LIDYAARELYLWEIEAQCQFTFKAWDNLEQAIRDGDYDLQMYSIQAFLVAAANVSKLLWPSPFQSKCGEEKPESAVFAEQRGEELRKLLSMSDDSPLHSRAFRNHVEHYDERMDDWVTSKDRGSHLGRISAISGMRWAEPEDFAWVFERDTKKLMFKTSSYDMEAAAKAARALHATCIDRRSRIRK
jgi:hypothetical protein